MRGRDWDRERRHRDEGGYGYGRYDADDREPDYARRGDERGFLERLREELRSWFGEDEPVRRRPRDDREAGRWGGQQDERDWARQWGYVEGREPRDRELGAARGWGHGGGYEASGGHVGSSEYGYDSPGSWRWTGPSRWGRLPFGSGYEDSWREERRQDRRAGASGGSFAGRGPRGYQRSDERIREDICERMCDNAELDASLIEIQVLNGEVTLQGTVNDRWDKRLAEDLTENVSGVREVNNHLRVAPGTSGRDEPQPPSQPRPGEQPRYRIA
jgi:hypothetical protein